MRICTNVFDFVRKTIPYLVPFWCAKVLCAATVTVTGSPGPGQGLANYYHTEPGDTVSLQMTTVKAPNGSVAAICTWTITTGPSAPNTYRDPNTGAVIHIDPKSTIIADPPAAPVVPGRARFRICEPIDTPQVKAMLYIRPPAGADVNIGGTITTDNQAAANPQGVFHDIDSFLASLNPPTIDVLAGDLPLSTFFYPLSFDTSPAAEALTQEILTSEGIGAGDWAVSVTSFFDDTGDRSALYTFTQVPDQEPTVALFCLSLMILVGFKWQLTRGNGKIPWIKANRDGI